VYIAFHIKLARRLSLSVIVTLHYYDNASKRLVFVVGVHRGVQSRGECNAQTAYDTFCESE